MCRKHRDKWAAVVTGSCTVFSERLGLRAGRVDVEVHGCNEVNIRDASGDDLFDSGMTKRND